MGAVAQEVTIKGKVILKGTLTIPADKKEKFPAILLLAGSGSLDRDGNAKRGKLQLNIYKDLADFLTSIGFMTLRYDKRGVGESEGNVLEAGMYDLVDDAEAAYRFLKQHPQVDQERLIVLGHSEGAILATALNAREPLAGLILLSGAGAKLDKVMKQQQQRVYSEMQQIDGIKGFLVRAFKVAEKAKKKNEALFAKVMTTDKDVIRVNGFIRINAKWLREHFAYDLFADYRKITCPVLAITGKKDIQVDANELDHLPNYIVSPLEMHKIDDMNHGLKVQKHDGSILNAKKEYVQDIGKELHPKLQFILNEWLTENFKKE